MTSLEENKVSMMLQVKSYLVDHAAKTEGLPGFGAYFSEFEGAMTRIDEYMQLQMKDTKGQTEMKRQLLMEMTELTVELANWLRVYAMNTKNQVLEFQMRVYKWPMIKLPDTMAADRGRGVLLKARENAGALEQYGIGEEKLVALEEAIEKYAAYIGRPRAAIAEKKAYRSGLGRALRDGMEALKKLDLLVGLKQWDEKGFYGSYKSLRRIEDHSIRHLAMKGKVVDAATGAGLKGVRLEMALQQPAAQKGMPTKKAQVVVKRSFDKGGFQMRRMEQGEWILRAIKLGYVEQELTVYVVKGEMKRVLVRLERKG